MRNVANLSAALIILYIFLMDVPFYGEKSAKLLVRNHIAKIKLSSDYSATLSETYGMFREVSETVIIREKRLLSPWYSISEREHEEMVAVFKVDLDMIDNFIHGVLR